MNKSLPVISVITIVKNNEELLPRAMDSVLAQSFTDFEHIIVNDGSTDGTKAIIEDYAEKDNRVKPKHMPQNVGRAMARNTGLDMAKGKYIFFLDADDYLPETSLIDLYEVAEMDNVDIVFGRFKAFDQQTGQMKDYHYTDDFINKELHKFRLDDHLDVIKNHSIIGRLYKRSLLEQHNIRFSTTRKNGEDVPFSFYTAFYASSMSMVPQKTIYYYSVGNFLATANESKLFDARDNLIETLEFSKEKGSEALIHMMQHKSANFAGNLGRAKVVFGIGEKFKAFLPSLVPLVTDIEDSVLKTLSPYHQNFVKSLIAGDFAKSFLLFTHKGKIASQQVKDTINVQQQEDKQIVELRLKIERMHNLNQDLALQLDTLYNSLSWRITKHLRVALKVLGVR